MTLLRFHCPVCSAPCEVSDATPSRTRCEQCGLLFVPTAPAKEAAPPETPHGQMGTIPPPPSVIYSTFAHYDAPAVAPDADSSTASPLGEESGPRSDSGHPSAEAPDAESPRRDIPDRPPGNLGPPPPYRPIVAAPKPSPPRAEIAPVSHSIEGSDRVVGALGPPPPYRPVIQTAPVFGRGPAPDLEPWRPVAFTRIQTDRRAEPETPLTGDDDDFAWSLPRQSDPEPTIPQPMEEVRREAPEDFGPRDRPLVWPRGREAPYDVPGPPRFSPQIDLLANPGPVARPGIARRLVRKVLWAAGIGVAVVGLALVLYVGRWRVMRTFPVTVPIYAAFHRSGGSPAPAPDQR